MTYTRIQNRLGTTAIAAVLALSSTQLAAQEIPSAEPAPVETMTTVSEPSAPTVDQADPLAPAPEREMATESVETTVTAEPEAPAAAKPAAKKSAAKTGPTEQSATSKPSIPAAPPASEAATEAPTPEPAAVAAIEPAAEVAPVVDAVPAEQAQLEEALPIAGGAGVILALAGAGMAVRRKRRKDDEEVDRRSVANDEQALAEEASWDPPVRAPKSAPIPAATEPTEVPESFDTSKFGRHVQAAYKGPTPDNPSLSLRKRLKIAGELDRRERIGSVPNEVGATQPPRMAFSFGNTADRTKAPEYQF